MRKTPIMKICEWCGDPFYTVVKKRRFCNPSCSARWRMNTTDFVEKNILSIPHERRSEISKKMHKDHPEITQAFVERMKKISPQKRKEAGEKCKAYWKKYGHPLSKTQPRGGNGAPLPASQRILFAALGEEWKIEYVIPTKQPRHLGYPTCYKVDLALPLKRVWIELDGWKHNIPEQQIKDKKKEDLLTKLGWRGLRFKNQEVMENLPIVLSTIYKFLDTPPFMRRMY